MDSTYLVAGLAVAFLAIVFAWYEVNRYKREIQRHKDAAIIYREFVLKQKYKLVDEVAARLKLQDIKLPPLTVASYSALVDLYDEPDLMPYGTPALAIDRYNINWTRDDLDNVELFVLWLSGFIDHDNA